MLLHNCVLRLPSKPERGWGGTCYTSLAGTLKDVVTATRRKHLLISEAALFQTPRARKHEQAPSGGCSCLNPHVELVASVFSHPGPSSLSLTRCAQQHPQACSSMRCFEGFFFPRPAASPPFLFLLPANTLTQLPAFSPGFSFSDFSFQLLHLVTFTCHISVSSPRGCEKPGRRHPIHFPGCRDPSGCSFLEQILSPLPEMALSCFFSSCEAVNRSHPLGEVQTSATPAKCPASCPMAILTMGLALQRSLVEGKQLCPEMAHPWGQVCAMALEKACPHPRLSSK